MSRRATATLLALVVGLAVVGVVASGIGGSTSADRARTAVTAPPEPCPEPLPGIVNNGERDERRVAITFDDGPSAATEDFLQALRRNDVRATFFVLGREIPGREGVLRRAVAEGHELGNHSTSHIERPGPSDIETTSELIEDATGRPPCVFRPPHGATSDVLIRNVRDLGMTVVGWDVDTEDWLFQTPSMIRDRALGGVEPGSIVLMHDGGGTRSGTARSLSAVIDALRARGYEFVTVSELLAAIAAT